MIFEVGAATRCRYTRYIPGKVMEAGRFDKVGDKVELVSIGVRGCPMVSEFLI